MRSERGSAWAQIVFMSTPQLAVVAHATTLFHCPRPRPYLAILYVLSLYIVARNVHGDQTSCH